MSILILILLLILYILAAHHFFILLIKAYASKQGSGYKILVLNIYKIYYKPIRLIPILDHLIWLCTMLARTL